MVEVHRRHFFIWEHGEGSLEKLSVPYLTVANLARLGISVQC